MQILRHAVRATVICGALAITPSMMAPAAMAQEMHDGVWRVATQPVTGPCDESLEFSIAVKDGNVRYAGFLPVNASGSVTPVGMVMINVVRGAETVSAKGVVRGDTASGKWVSPTKQCTGSWTATKA